MMSLIDTVLHVAGAADRPFNSVPISVLIFTPADIPSTAKFELAQIVLPPNANTQDRSVVQHCSELSKLPLILPIHTKILSHCLSHCDTKSTESHKGNLGRKLGTLLWQQFVDQADQGTQVPFPNISSTSFVTPHREGMRLQAGLQPIRQIIGLDLRTKGESLWESHLQQHAGAQLTDKVIAYMITGKRPRGRPVSDTSNTLLGAFQRIKRNSR